MLKITFPDGKHKEYESGITGFDIASDISLSLSKVAVAITVNGHQKDLTDPINEDSLVNIITSLVGDSGSVVSVLVELQKENNNVNKRRKVIFFIRLFPLSFLNSFSKYILKYSYQKTLQ